MFYVIHDYKCGRCDAEHCVVFFAPIWVASKCRACRDARVTPGQDYPDSLVELARKVVRDTVDFLDNKTPLKACKECEKKKELFRNDKCLQCWTADRERERRK